MDECKNRAPGSLEWEDGGSERERFEKWRESEGYARFGIESDWEIWQGRQPEIDVLNVKLESMIQAKNKLAIEVNKQDSEIVALQAENEKLREEAEQVCKAAEALQSAVNKLWEAEYPDESDNPAPAMDIDDARQLHFEACGTLDTAIYYMRKRAAITAPDTKGE